MKTVDRTGWGSGEWDDEPDYEQRIDATGYHCIARRHGSFGHWCGYVGVPVGHPWHGRSYSDIDANVHGGLTYSDDCLADEPPGLWWLGFDCLHAWDFAPGYSNRFKEIGIFEDYAGVYRTIDYVMAQCAALAKQAADADQKAAPITPSDDAQVDE